MRADLPSVATPDIKTALVRGDRRVCVAQAAACHVAATEGGEQARDVAGGGAVPECVAVSVAPAQDPPVHLNTPRPFSVANRRTYAK